jgi:hypothetical protein
VASEDVSREDVVWICYKATKIEDVEDLACAI